jgi:hypothetical protein
MDTVRWLQESKLGKSTHVVIISEKSHMPRREAATPRTAAETMCVTGEVTLIDKRVAILMRKPKVPYPTGRLSSFIKTQEDNLP